MIDKYHRSIVNYTLLPILIIIFLLTSYPTQANQPVGNNQGFLPDVSSDIDGYPTPFIEQNKLWVAPEGWDFHKQAPSDELARASQTDDFGYSWNDTVSVDWIDATGGANTGMSGSSTGQYVGPIGLGFTFPYYENTYAQVYIGASGFITFSYSESWPSQSQIPTPSQPNNVIAPYWAPFHLSDTGPLGQVYYLQGGEAPERFFVVEWADVAGGKPDDPVGGSDLYHFQVILKENGDIRFQYDQMIYEGNSYCGAAGIEDVLGEDGLNYLPFCAPAPSNRAVLFSRPDPAARLRMSPPYRSSFINPGSSVSFPILVSNLGDLGEDTFDLSANVSWSLGFYASDGLTPLTDTNANGSIDTGVLGPGQTREIIVKVTAPEDIPIGTFDQIAITATSTINPARSARVTLQVAVPARFTQAFRDGADGAMGMFLAQPGNFKIKKVTNDAWWGYNPAIAEMNMGGFVYLWQRWRYSDNTQNFNTELEFVFLDNSGSSLIPITQLTDHRSATLITFDEEPVVAVAPNGTIGVAWRRRILRQSVDSIQENWNVYFATLNNEGQIKFGPTNLTQNDGWHQTNPVTYDIPRFRDVRLAVNEANDFAMTWRRESQEAPSPRCANQCKLDDIYFTIRNSSGAPIVSPTRVTTDTPGMNEGYFSPTVQHLSNNRWLLVYSHNPGGLAFSVLDGQGNLIRGRSFIGKFGWAPVAKQLTRNGPLVIAWTAWTGNNPQIHVLVLDADTYQRISGPVILSNPAASTGGDYASLAVDSNGRAILTWMDFSANNRRHLYYALLDETGSLITSPMVFHHAVSNTNGSLNIESGFSGYSSTSNRQFMDVSVNYWAAGWIERLYDAGIIRGCTADPPLYCPEETTTRAQMAVFLVRAIYGSDFIPPAVSEPVFTDVPASHWAAPWIEQLYHDGLTSGCAQEPLRYCPERNINRDEMAVFLIRVMYGNDYVPPEPSGLFVDVPTDYWAAAWIEQLYRDGITTGCNLSPLQYCPGGETTRAEMAVFLGRTFNIP